MGADGTIQLTSSLIDRYINAIELDPEAPIDKRVRTDPQLEIEVAMLKELTWDYVLNNPALATQQEGQRRMIRTLFRVFGKASANPNQESLFPVSYREALKQIEESDDGQQKRT